MGLVESSYAFEEMHYSEYSTPKSPLSIVQPFHLSPLEPDSTSDGDSQAATPEEPGTMTPADDASEEPPVELLAESTPDDLPRVNVEDLANESQGDEGVQSSPSHTDTETSYTDAPLVDSPLPLLDLVDFDTGLNSPSPFNLDTPALDTLDLPSCTTTAVHTPLPSFVKSEDAVPLFDTLPLVDTMSLPWCISQNASAASPFTPFAWADANTTLPAPFDADFTLPCDPLSLRGPVTAPPLTAPLPAPLATPISTTFAAPLSAPAFAPTPYATFLTALNTPSVPPASRPTTPAPVPKLLPVPKAYKHHTVPPRIHSRDEDDEADGNNEKPAKRTKRDHTNTSYTLLEAYVSHVEYDCVTGKWWE